MRRVSDLIWGLKTPKSGTFSNYTKEFEFEQK